MTHIASRRERERERERERGVKSEKIDMENLLIKSSITYQPRLALLTCLIDLTTDADSFHLFFFKKKKKIYETVSREKRGCFLPVPTSPTNHSTQAWVPPPHPHSPFIRNT